MTGRLPVLFAIDGLWVGGSERSLVEMIPGLVAHGIEPTIACFRRYPEEGVEDRVPAAMVRYLDGRGFVAQVASLRRLVRTLRPEIVHTSLFHANFVGRLAASGLPVRVLNSLVNVPYDPARFRDPRIRAARLRAAQLLDVVTGRLLADHFHAVSHSVAAAGRASLRIPAERITVIERGRDPERLGRPSARRRVAARRALGIDDQAQVIVTVGRQEFQKGQEHLLHALARLAPRFPDLVLLVAGRRGAATGRLLELTESLGLADRIAWLGHRDDVPEILASADVFVFPSLWEGYPGAVLEAMALALPVVASGIAPVCEIIEPGRTGRLVRPGAPEELAEVVAELLADPGARSALGSRARERFLAEHTLDSTVPRMAALYHRLARTS